MKGIKLARGGGSFSGHFTGEKTTKEEGNEIQKLLPHRKTGIPDKTLRIAGYKEVEEDKKEILMRKRKLPETSNALSLKKKGSRRRGAVAFDEETFNCWV